jgi:hypothetical protein
MNDLDFSEYCCPLFIFEPEQRQGKIVNPATRIAQLILPRQIGEYAGYPLHEDSRLSSEFASYLHYLVHEHILFTRLAVAEVCPVEADPVLDDELSAEEDDRGLFDFSTVWFRAPLDFPGLSGLYDSLGFCFLDGALFNPMYCEVIETRA